MIRVENVSKQFNKTRALKNVSLEVNKGDIISLIGPISEYVGFTKL